MDDFFICIRYHSTEVNTFEGALLKIAQLLVRGGGRIGEAGGGI